MGQAIVRSDVEQAALYDYLYKTPSKGRLWNFFCRRVSFFTDYLKDMPRGNVLDVGCGRGQLMRVLRSLGYAVEGTEIADCLFADDLLGLSVKQLPCSRLGEIPSASYDYVICTEVLEHLNDEREVEQAIGNLARISRKHVLISTAGTKGSGSPKGQTHLTIRPREWWVGLFQRYCFIDKEFDACGSVFLFGVKQ